MSFNDIRINFVNPRIKLINEPFVKSFDHEDGMSKAISNNFIFIKSVYISIINCLLLVQHWL